MMRRSAAAAFAIAAALLPAVAHAQTRPHPAPPDRTWEIAPYVGVARHSPGGRHLGEMTGLNHLFLGVHLTAALLHARGFTLAFAPELVPLLLVWDVPTYHSTGAIIDLPIAVPRRDIDGVGPVAGIGGSPVGFEGRLNVGSRLRLYTATAAGFVFFSRNTPLPYARRFNYTFEVGGGVDWQLRKNTLLRVGYKFHHFSNGNSGLQNPGVDGEVITVGCVRRFSGHQRR